MHVCTNSALSPLRFLNRFFKYLSEIFSFKLSDLDKSHMNRGLFNVSPMRQQKLPIFTFPITSHWNTISCHSNQSSFILVRLEQKHNYSFPPSIDAICVI